ncbi:MAG: putative metal-binding motif-containing protein [Sandaracinaceae bacterium]
MRCDEESDECVSLDCEGTPDADGDGFEDTRCGGDDCDDSDPTVFPGATEICDAAGRDEDCDSATLAGADGDADGDGAVSTACCNGEVCGDDCDDAARSTFPGAIESCDGRDEDWDRNPDETGAAPICPGGVCTAGRCDLQPWARTFGDVTNDQVIDAVMDEVGNVYATGTFTRDADFGSSDGSVTSVISDEFDAHTPDIFILSYGPDGRYRWVQTIGTQSATEIPTGIAYDPGASQIYVIGNGLSEFDLGSGTARGGFILALNTSGEAQWDVRRPPAPCFVGYETVESMNGPIVGGTFRGDCVVAGDELSSASFQGFVAQYDASGEGLGTYVPGGGGVVRINSIDAHEEFGFLVGGSFAIEANFGGSVRTPAGRDDAFVLGLDSALRHSWDYIAGGSEIDRVNAVAFSSSGAAVAVGQFFDDADFGMGVVAVERRSSFLVSLSASGGLTRFRSFGGGSANGVVFNSVGSLLVAGSFSESVNFGGGLITGSPAGAGFLATYDSEFNHLEDRVFAYPGFPGLTDCGAPGCGFATASGAAIGPADSTVVFGSFGGGLSLPPSIRASAGGGDGFIYRLEN